ncbi:MAG: ferrous iron transport protein B, partial [Oscillospiraceae bacterium]
MGLTSKSTGKFSIDNGLTITRENPSDKVIALAGNPNVGKSTVFNELTGLNQHTGNWPGKTVTNAQGKHHYTGLDYTIIDLPGTYSLMAHSTEEEVARDFICFGNADCVVVVCDATCIERNLNLVLQTIEITKNVVVCVNLMDEAKRKKVFVNITQLEENLGVPVVSTSARSGKGLKELMQQVSQICICQRNLAPIEVRYIKPIEEAISIVEPVISKKIGDKLNPRWVSLKLIDSDDTLKKSLFTYLNFDISQDIEVVEAVKKAHTLLKDNNIEQEHIKDKVVSCLVLTAQGVSEGVVACEHCKINTRDRKLDKILTSKWTGIPIMLALLCIVFWITITGANYPSQLLSTGLFWIQDRLVDFFIWLGTPPWVHGVLVLGVYRVLAWVVAVMLPPMAIFFPLFTLLEDFGYLPRVAFNLDHYFKKSNACGKQALTMCMGFGCNAAGVVGCRIIDSPRERLIAIITNTFVPCNGRFPTLIAIITMFFAGVVASPFQSFLSTLLLTGVILLGILLTFWVSKLLSVTVLKGVPSSFTLELPPYRKPQIGKVIVRSIFDRTLFVLGRAVAVAAPAGMIIWIMANFQIDGISLLKYCAEFLDPFAKLIGMDG